MGFGDFLKGAAGGALGGSAFGPGGALIGGLGGGLLGYLGGGDPSQQYRDQLSAMAGRPAPQMGPAAQGQTSSFRGNQSALISQLEAQSRGEGPSLAQQQLEAATDRNSRAAQSVAAGAGPNAAMAQFQAQNTMGNLGAQAAQDAAIARIQEQYNAQNLLGLNLQGARGQDESMSQFNAGQTNAGSQANLQAKLQSMGLSIEALRAAGMIPAQPGLGDQILAGGAGMASFAASQKAANAQGGQPAQGGQTNYFAPGQGMQPGFGAGQPQTGNLFGPGGGLGSPGSPQISPEQMQQLRMMGMM